MLRTVDSVLADVVSFCCAGVQAMKRSGAKSHRPLSESIRALDLPDELHPLVLPLFVDGKLRR